MMRDNSFPDKSTTDDDNFYKRINDSFTTSYTLEVGGSNQEKQQFLEDLGSDFMKKLQGFKKYLCGEYTNKTTIKNNYSVVKGFCVYVGGILSQESVQKWRQHINETKAHNTINVSISAVNKFLSWCNRKDLRMKTIGQKDTDKETLTEQEIILLLERSKNDPETHLILLLLFQALRPNEIINAKISNIGGDILYLKDTKTGDNHTILTKEIIETIERYQKVKPHPKQGYEDYLLICNHSEHKGKPYVTTLPIQKKIRKLSKNSGICKEVTPYMIRRTSATLRLDINSKFYAGDVKIVQRLFRHKSPETTLRYDHKTDNDLRKYLQETEKDFAESGKDLIKKKNCKEGLIP
jgi:integrase